ncbi:MAG TPA: DedA family protein [Thermodesulfobacteriota bacterium]|nr:DedA family protein [Thermodesulfobacteriota bacterium]
MELLHSFIEIFLHLDKHIDTVVQNYGVWTYLILFLIIFCETGLVVTPVLPGDSLLFVVGAVAALGSLDLKLLFALLGAAAVLGDTVNYGIGHYVGPRVFLRTDSRIFRKEYLDRTHAFYEKYGGKTIILARFVPIVRTFAPFVAGVGAMSYGRFIVYNIVGGLCWITLFLFGGYLFGNIPSVKHYFSFFIIAIIILSVSPGFIEYMRHRRRAR